MIHFDQIERGKLIKGVCNWVNITLTDLDNPLDSDHFAFGFETRSPKNIVNFSFWLLNEKVELVTFIDGEKKSSLLIILIIKIVRNGQHNPDLDKQVERIVQELRKVLLKL